MSTTTQAPGRDWLAMKPAHFDRSQLPRRHRKPEPEGLFSVADVAPEATPRAPEPRPELDGQEDLFGGTL